MPIRAHLLLLSLPLLLCACSGGDGSDGAPEEAETGAQMAGGNSGSEGQAPPPPPLGGGADPVLCPCQRGGQGAGHYLRATLLSQREPEGAGDDASVLLRVVSLRVEEMIHGDSPLRVGDMIEASWDGTLPCWLGQASFDDGQQVLALFTPAQLAQDACDEEAPQGYCCDEEEWCFARVAARAGEMGLLESCRHACDEDGRYICRETSWATGEVKLTAWEDALLFAATEAAELRVPAAELGALWDDGGACVEAYGNWSDLASAAWPSSTCIVDGEEAPCRVTPSEMLDACMAEREQPQDTRCTDICARIEAICGDNNGVCIAECSSRRATAAACEQPGRFDELLDCCADAELEEGCAQSFDACRTEACGHLEDAGAGTDDGECAP